MGSPPYKDTVMLGLIVLTEETICLKSSKLKLWSSLFFQKWHILHLKKHLDSTFIEHSEGSRTGSNVDEYDSGETNNCFNSVVTSINMHNVLYY